MMVETLVFKTALKPTKKQAIMLNSHFGAARFAYNCLLNYTIEAWDEHKKDPLNAPRPNLTQPALQKLWVNELRDNFAPWHKDNSSRAYRHGAASLAKAYKGFFSIKSKGHPKFKNKSSGGSFAVGASDTSLKDGGRIVTAPKIGAMLLQERLKQADWLQRMGATLQEVNFSKDASGKYFVSIRYRVPDHVALMFFRGKFDRRGAGFIGVDRGLKDFLVTSEGSIVANPRFYRKLEAKIARANRSVSLKKSARKRTQPRSKSEEKARLKLARIHKKVKARRKDFTDKTARNLISQNTTIVLEDLNIAGMKKSNLGKSISDAGWGQFATTLNYMANRYGAKVILADRYFASSQICSRCGARAKTKLSLSQRIFNCNTCFFFLDRDLNAALNLKVWGKQYLKRQAAVRCTEALNGGEPGDLIALDQSRSKLESKKRPARLPNGVYTPENSLIINASSAVRS